MEKHEKRLYCWLLALLMVGAAAVQVFAQAPSEGTYQPKFAGDPAHSESEAEALAYMRTFLRAEHTYKKKHGKYAVTMTALAGTGSFTKRMASTKDRGDYMVGFRMHKDKGSDTEGFVLTMTPKKMDGEHRSFYAEDDGVIHADDQKAADAESPKLR